MLPVSVCRWGLGALLSLTLLPGYGQRRNAKSPAGVACWLTTPDQKQLLQPQAGKLAFGKAAPTGAVIDVNDSQTYQTMDGFGYCLTGGSAYVLSQMSAGSGAQQPGAVPRPPRTKRPPSEGGEQK